MAMSDKIASQKAGEVAPKPVVGGVSAPTVKAPQKAGAGSKKIEAFKNQGALIRQGMSEDQKAAECSKSDKVVFVACIGNPTKIVQRKVKNEYQRCPLVVGYTLKALEDMEVPRAPFKENCKDILDVQLPATTRQVKAGETFKVNVVEAAILMSRVEYTGKFCGEGKEVYLSATTSSTRENPTPCLKTSEGSIKEQMELIAEMVGAVDGRGGKPKLNPGYEDFAELLVSRSTGRTGGSRKEREKGEAHKNLAAAFRQMYN